MSQRSIATVTAAALAWLVAPAPALALNAYITNEGSNNVSVINTATNTVIATIPVGFAPFGVTVTPDSTKVYVTNQFSNNVSVIATATNTVIATIPVGPQPVGA
jgi:YVTN family beta-propeller protein